MMKFSATAEDGTALVCLGLSDENVRRLPTAPIIFELSEILPDADATVALVYLASVKGTNARQAEMIAKGLATRMLRPEGERSHIVLALDDATLARMQNPGGVIVRNAQAPLRHGAAGRPIEFILTRGRTEKDLLEEYASLIGPQTRTRVDPRTL
jgi:hypothetical protein